MKDKPEHSIEVEGVDCELRLDPDGYECKFSRTPEGGFIIGYLLHDEDCSNPLDNCDGMGKIYSCDSTLCNYLEPEQAIYRLKSNLAVPLEYTSQGEVQYEASQRTDWDETNVEGIWEPDDCCREHIGMSARAMAVEMMVKRLNPDANVDRWKLPLRGVKIYPGQFGARRNVRLPLNVLNQQNKTNKGKD